MNPKVIMKSAMVACGLAIAGIAAGEADVISAKNRSVELTYTATIENIPDGALSIDVWLPIAQDTDGQTVSRVQVNYPEGGDITTESQYGNKIWHKRFEAPFSDSLGAEIVFDIHRAEIVIREAKELADTPKLKSSFAEYLKPNGLIPIQIDPVNTIAADLKLKDHGPIVAGRKIYDWLIDEFTYNWQAPGAGKGDVRWACDSKTGDCNDYHSMFLALCRNQGIPADHEFGFPIRSKRSEGIIPSYHCWARFHVKGIGWIPIDASEADKHPELREYNFGSQSVSLLKFTHGRDVTLSPPQKGPALNKFIHPYVEVDGKPYGETDINYKVRFRDLATKN
jgi:transglutaminase-like putative cysteine protease